MENYRIGIGLDSHRIKLKIKNAVPGGRQEKLKIKKNLILGGVLVSKKYYALADSEGDVIIHSLCNALSTAIGGGSLDTWAGPMFKRGVADSKEFLKVILEKAKKQGYSIRNVAIMVEAQRPKLEKHRLKIQVSLAKLLKIKESDVGLAFTTGQDLTVFGKGEGIQVFSTVLIYK